MSFKATGVHPELTRCATGSRIADFVEFSVKVGNTAAMSFLDKPDPQNEVLVLGIGNILYADEGFGPRAVEHFHRTYSPRDGVVVMDGGTLGYFLVNDIMNAKRLLVLDCCDFKREPGYMGVLRGEEVKAWQCTKISPHQTGINDLLFNAMLMDYEPEALTVIGIQPENMEDYGGGLSQTLASHVDEAVELAKAFGSDNSSKFVNGVLGTAYRQIYQETEPQGSKESHDQKTLSQTPASDAEQPTQPVAPPESVA